MGKRTALLVVLTSLAAGTALAISPGARYDTRMAYDANIQRVVQFGGLTAIDAGTAKAYDLGDTWEWNGQKWVERYTPTAPQARSAHNMLYDSNRQRVLLFFGKNGSTYLNDTWQYVNGKWSQINTANAPGPRTVAGAAYDSARDRVVVYGGTSLDASNKAVEDRDTWEFDGTNWTHIADNGPDVGKPILVYDRLHNKILMLAEDTALTPKMFAYDPAGKSWQSLTPTALPACVNEGMVTYDTTRDVVVYTGGTCSTSSTTDDTYEWTGDNWTHVTLNSNAGRTFGAGLAYDEARQETVLFAGYYSTAPRHQTYLYLAGGWISTADDQPVPRSLAVFANDVQSGTVWLFGGTSMGNQLNDFWTYQNGHFNSVSSESKPVSCGSPHGAFDTDRKLLVVYCGIDNTTYEYTPDTNVWKSIASKHVPAARSFGALVYDQTLKLTVLFGGWDATLFRDDTWTWNGTDWTQVKKDPPPSRELPAMWWDPILKKTVIFGGLGRLDPNARLSRYNDMWTFDGTAWTQLTPSTLPGTRYGAKVAIDPRTNHTFLFGGMLDTVNGKTETQSYAADTWEWDGATWKQVATDGVPPARENQAFIFDPNRNEMVMFAGYSGYYLSDLWSFTNSTTWRPWVDTTLRRRAAGQ